MVSAIIVYVSICAVQQSCATSYLAHIKCPHEQALQSQNPIIQPQFHITCNICCLTVKTPSPSYIKGDSETLLGHDALNLLVLSSTTSPIPHPLWTPSPFPHTDRKRRDTNSPMSTWHLLFLLTLPPGATPSTCLGRDPFLLQTCPLELGWEVRCPWPPDPKSLWCHRYQKVSQLICIFHILWKGFERQDSSETDACSFTASFTQVSLEFKKVHK